MIAVLLLLAFVDPVLANWWIVRAADGKCLVVDIEPSGNDKDVTKVARTSTSHANRPKLTSKRFAKKIRIRAPQEKPSEAACHNVVE